MLFQNIVKGKEKLLGPLYGGAGVGTSSPNERCSAYTYLKGTGRYTLST
jgi:hypothetical protein